MLKIIATEQEQKTKQQQQQESFPFMLEILISLFFLLWNIVIIIIIISSASYLIIIISIFNSTSKKYFIERNGIFLCFSFFRDGNLLFAKRQIKNSNYVDSEICFHHHIIRWCGIDMSWMWMMMTRSRLPRTFILHIFLHSFHFLLYISLKLTWHVQVVAVIWNEN